MKRSFIVLSVIVTMLLSACGVERNDSAYSNEQDNDGIDLISNRNEMGARNVADKPELETRENPNNYVGVQQVPPSMGTDIDKARQVVAMYTDLQPGSVWINGPYMWVTVYKKGNLTQQEKIDEEARVHKLLIKALPRYDIEVNVRGDRS